MSILTWTQGSSPASESFYFNLPVAHYCWDKATVLILENSACSRSFISSGMHCWNARTASMQHRCVISFKTLIIDN
jgi:hypothetical protein